jgi:hypothetical protein
MTKSIITILCLGLSTLSFGQNYFQKIFGDSTIQEKGALVHQTADGTIYYFGNKQSNNQSAIAFFKMTADGQIILEQEIGLNSSLFANAMLFEGDKFLVIGEQRYAGSSNIDGFAIFIDTLGQVLQSQTYGLPNKTEVFKSVIKAQNGGYVISGFATAQNNVGNDIYLTSLTQNLVQEWAEVSGSPVNEVAQKAIQLPNGNLFLVGDQLRVSTGLYNVYCQFHTADGRFLSDFTIPEIYNGGSKSMILDANNDIVIIGEMSSSTSPNFDMYMVKLDLNGNLIWKKYLTNTMNGDAGFGIIQPTNDTYLVTGYAAGLTSQTQDIALISTDTSGNVIERKFYGGAGIEIGYTVFPSVNGGYLVAGFDNIGSDVQYLLIYDNIDLTVSTSEIQLIENSLTIFPNPVVQQKFNFNQSIEKAKIVILNLQGQVIESGFIHNNDTYQLKNNLPSGNYFVNLQFESFQKTIQIFIAN